MAPRCSNDAASIIVDHAMLRGTFFFAGSHVFVNSRSFR